MTIVSVAARVPTKMIPHDNNEADTGAECRSIRDRQHSNDEECDNDPHTPGTTRSRSASRRHLPALGWTDSTVACQDRRVGVQLAPAGGLIDDGRILIQRLIRIFRLRVAATRVMQAGISLPVTMSA